MKYFSLKQKKGFTIVEVMVTISIIVVLSTVVLFSIADARKVSRDMVRQSVAEQLKLAVRLHKESNSTYLSYPNPNPIPITPNNVIGLQLAPYVKGFQGDPVGTAGYGYYYDSDFDCTEPGQKVILVRTLEKKSGNIEAVCGSVTLPPGWDDSKVFITII